MKVCDIEDDTDQIGQAVAAIGGVSAANNSLLNQILTLVSGTP